MLSIARDPTGQGSFSMAHLKPGTIVELTDNVHFPCSTELTDLGILMSRSFANSKHIAQNHGISGLRRYWLWNG
jgi:hypothetical protein